VDSASCGVSGLARRGYRVHGTDISERSLDRARKEAERLGAMVSFGACDFRDLSSIDGLFDVVIACDNSIPHLSPEHRGQQGDSGSEAGTRSCPSSADAIESSATANH
jgi:SAM-dependent methyltransferase